MTQKAVTIPKNRELPAKQANLLKELVRHYEHRQYKKGLKVAESILKKFPEHGETISLKGLFQSHLGKKEEALQNIKLGIRKDLTSHVCWHVFGLYYRNEKNYKETVRCYKTALKYDPGNLQILRDLGSVQIQLRDYDGFLTTKLETLELKPSLKVNWISLAIAYHLVKNWDSACKVIDTFMESWNGTRDNRFADRVVDYEISELILYKLFILEEAKKWDSLLEAVELSKDLVLDKTSLLEFTAKSLAASSQKERAMETYKILLQRNPDNRKYLDAMENLLGASDEKKNLVQFYTSLMVELPQAHLSCQKRLLELLTKEDSFIELFSEYVVNFLKKGVPALFELCRPLLAEPKLAWIKKVLSDLEEVNRNTNIENFYSWILYFNCQLSLYEKDPVNALEHIEKALSIDPENVDFLMKKARCLKHLDRIETAAATMNEARLLDLSDRYINSKCAKYYLRAGDIESAQKIITLFLKGEYPAKVADLMEIQTLWWQLELADAHLRVKSYGQAMKAYDSLVKIFNEFVEDQFDFHSYGVRKFNLISYIDLLRFEDRIFEQPIFKRALAGMGKCYSDLIEDPSLIVTQQLEKVQLTTMPASESQVVNISTTGENNQVMKLNDSTVDNEDDGEEPVALLKKSDDDPFGLEYLKGDLSAKFKSFNDLYSKFITSY